MKAADEQAMNADVTQWSTKVFDLLKQEFDVLKIEHVARSPSPKAAKDDMLKRLGYEDGVVSRIGFRFPRHMVFVHKGVGKGVKASQVGSHQGTRKPKEWFNPVIEKQMEELAEIVAEHTGEMVVKNLKIR